MDGQPDSQQTGNESTDNTEVFIHDSSNQASPSLPTPAPEPKKSKWRWLRPELILIPPFRRKLGRRARPTAVAVLLVLLIGAGLIVRWQLTNESTLAKSNATAFKAVLARFKVVSTVPALNATNVNPASDITINFSQPVNAAKLVNNMFVSPTIQGTFTQGKTPKQIIFKPSAPLNKGTKVTVMINGTYESRQGSRLGLPYFYGFTTAIPGNGVEFADSNGDLDNLISSPSGQTEDFKILLGDQVGSGASVSLYKDTADQLLQSFVYSTDNSYGFPYSSFNNLSVSTSGLTAITSLNNITNNEDFKVKQPDGLYVAVATNSKGDELGLVWIDFSNFGVILRQDDQKVIYDSQLFANNQEVPADVSLYSLNNQVALEDEATASGLTTRNVEYSKVDIAVATYNSETVVVPINVPNSGGDIRVDQDLSSALSVYGLTDKPTYKTGETISYAGFARNDNDAQYSLPSQSHVALYVAAVKGGTHLANFTAPIDSNGQFKGTITADSSWLNSGDQSDQFQIFAAAQNGNSVDDQPVGSFVVTTQSNPNYQLSVNFTKSSYLPNQPITVNVSGTKTNGQPMAGVIVHMNVTTSDYYDNNPTANNQDFGDSNGQLFTPFTVTLDNNGHASWTLNPLLLPADGNSQLVNVQASVEGDAGSVGGGASDSAIIHQGDAIITYGPERNEIPPGDDLTTSVYVTNLAGTALTSTTVNYKVENDSSVLGTGSVTTDGFGYAKIDVPASQASGGDQLVTSVTDSGGNVVSSYFVYSYDSGGYDETYDTSGASLLDLNVSGAPSNLTVGDHVNLTVNSPSNIKALVTFERGRIYNPEMLNLNQGNNSLSFTVSSQLAPSFTLTFNYLINGVYHSEGVSFNVSEPSRQANVSISSGQMTANQPATVQVKVTDSNDNPISSSLIAEIVTSNSYALNSQVNPDMFTSLYGSRQIMTSSSSSLSIVGSGGGRCGGGGGNLVGFANALGTVATWQPSLQTNGSGLAYLSFTPTTGSYTVNVYSMSGDNLVGSGTATFTAQ